METVTVRLTGQQIEWLSANPDTVSVTLRALVEHAITRTRRPADCDCRCDCALCR